MNKKIRKKTEMHNRTVIAVVIFVIILQVILVGCANVVNNKQEKQYNVLKNSVQKHAYVEIYNKLQVAQNNDVKQQEIEINLIEEKDLREVLKELILYTPEMYWLDPTIEYQYVSDNATQVTGILIKTQYTVEQRQQGISAIQQELTKIHEEVKGCKTDKERYQTIYKQLKENHEYATGDIRNVNNTIYGVLINKEGSCQGYAYSYWYICRKEGLKCKIQYGDIRERRDGNKEVVEKETIELSTHVWNKIEIDGQEYSIDLTEGIQKGVNDIDEILF